MIRDMPHVSKRKVEQKIVVLLDKHLYKLIRDSGSKTRLLVFGELLTKTETTMLAKRLGILLLLRKGLSTNKIAEILGTNILHARVLVARGLGSIRQSFAQPA